MTRLWPSYSGIDLNNEVAYLFFYTKNKFSNNLINNTNYHLYLDILNISAKKMLFQSLLDELEILVLDIVELDLSPKDIKYLSYKIVCDLVSRSERRFLKSIVSSKSDFDVNTGHNFIINKYTNLVLSEYSNILQNLLIYVIFGSSLVPTNSLGFNCYNTPGSYISILLESSILQLSDLVTYMVLGGLANLSTVFTFLSKYRLCNPSYLSIRSLACFKNSLIYQNLIYLYIDYPKSIYNCRYRVLLISSQGIISRYVYIPRFEEISNFSSWQFLTIFFIEFQDLILPKFEKSLLTLCKFVIYILINLFTNFFILIIKVVTARLSVKDI